MEQIIRVLGLDDDNHTTYYCTENYNDEGMINRVARYSPQMILHLADKLNNPDGIKYDIRWCDVLDLEESAYLEAFDIVNYFLRADDEKYQKAFNLLWEVAKTNTI